MGSHCPLPTSPCVPSVCQGRFVIVQVEVTVVRTTENCPLLPFLLLILSSWSSSPIQPFTEHPGLVHSSTWTVSHRVLPLTPPRYVPDFSSLCPPSGPRCLPSLSSQPSGHWPQSPQSCLSENRLGFLSYATFVRGAFSQEAFHPPSHQASQPRAASLPSCSPGSVTLAHSHLLAGAAGFHPSVVGTHP